MAIDYRVGVDWDNDAYVCWDAAPGDPVNLADHPVILDDNTLSTVGTGSSHSIDNTAGAGSDFGRLVIDWASGSSNNGYLQIGAFTDRFAPAVQNTAYTLVLYIRSESPSYDAVPLRIDLRKVAGFDGSIGVTGNFTVTTAEDWKQIVVNFTTPSDASLSGLYFRLQKNTSTTTASYDISGLMLLQGHYGNSNPPLPPFNTGAVSLYDNITGYVRQMKWNSGAREAYVAVADSSSCEIELNNVSKLFSLEYSGSPIFGNRNNRLVKVELYGPSSGTWRRKYTGWIESLLAQPGIHSERRAFLIATSARRFMEGKQIRIDLQVSQHAGQVLQAIFNQIEFPVGVTPAINVQNGTFTWPYAGDNWEDGTDALGAMTEVVQSERGFLYWWATTGGFIFHNRTDRYDSDDEFPTLAATFDNAQESMDYRYGDVVYNDIEVVRYPRRASSSTTLLLWTLDETLTLAAGEQYTMFVRYTDDADKTIGADPATVAEGSFTASGSGVVRTLTPKANGCTILYNNTSGSSRNVTAHTLTGRRIISKNAVTINVEDAASIAEHGRKTLRLDLKQVAAKADAKQIADLELARHKNPVGRVASITIGPRNSAHEDHIVFRDEFDRVRVIESQTGIDAEYLIIGMEHEVTKALKYHRVTYFLEPIVNLL